MSLSSTSNPSKKKDFLFPITLMVVTFLAYGVFINWLGFYLDDWYIMLNYKALGAASFKGFFAADRPLFGYIYQVFVPIFKDSRLGWQAFALVTHWLAAYSFFLALTTIEPSLRKHWQWVSLMFLVYPGFEFHWFSVMYSQVFLLMALYFYSYWTMVKAVTSKGKSARSLWTMLTLILMLIGIAPMEYFYGLELVRPVVLYYLLVQNSESSKPGLRRLFAKWLPYLAGLVAFTAYRIVNNQSYSYSISLIDKFKESPLPTLLGLIQAVGASLFDASIWVWSNAEKVFSKSISSRFTLVMIAIIGFTALLCFLTVSLRRSRFNANRKTSLFLILVGLYAAVVALVPFVVGSFTVNLSFPNNRFLLALAPGVSLTTVGLLSLVFTVQGWPSLIYAMLIGLSTGIQMVNARGFMIQYDNQKALFQEMIWRIPSLTPGTALVTDDIYNSEYSSGSSLSAPLNLIFNQQPINENLNYQMIFLGSPQADGISGFEAGESIDLKLRNFKFNGNTSDMLLFTKNWNSCFRVVYPSDNALDFRWARQYLIWEKLIPLTNLGTIELTDVEQELPSRYFGTSLPRTWCYYFEKADLALQKRNLEEVKSLYMQAQDSGLSSSVIFEWLPLLKAEILSGNVQSLSIVDQKVNPVEIGEKTTYCTFLKNIPAEALNEDSYRMVKRIYNTRDCGHTP